MDVRFLFALACGVGICLGITLASIVPFASALAACFLMCAGAAVLVARQNPRTFSLLIVVTLSCAAIGIVRATGDGQERAAAALYPFIGHSITVLGTVATDPSVRDKTVHISLTVTSVSFRGMSVALREPVGVLLIVAKFTPVTYGDVLSVTGVLSVPESFEGEFGRTFDYRGWLSARGITYSMVYPKVTIENTPSWSFRRMLFSIKRGLLDSLARTIPYPESALAGGLLLGERVGLGEVWERAFRTTGVMHIVVLSGYNVTLIAEAMRVACGFLPRMWGLITSATLIISFMVMTGASATIVRATIMGLLVMVARATGRTYAIVQALVVAGIFMLLWEPRLLLNDPAFQLSFIATVGLIVLSPRIEMMLTLLPLRFGIRPIVAATLATQIAVAPLLIYLIGEFSLVAPLANALVLVAVPLAMLTSFLAGVGGIAEPLLGAFIGVPAFLILTYQLAVIDFLSKAPFASVVIPPVPFVLVGAVYIAGMSWYFYASGLISRTASPHPPN